MRADRFIFEIKTAGARLDQFLHLELTRASKRDLTKSAIRRLIMGGAVFVNRKPTRVPTLMLQNGMKIEVVVEWERVGREVQRSVAREIPALRILFEDEVLILVDKPAGLPSQPTLDLTRPSVLSRLREQLQARQAGVESYLALAHRLDVETSGVLLLVKEPKVNKAVAELFAGHQIDKVYQAICRVTPLAARLLKSESWEVKNHLGVVGRNGKSKKFGKVRAGGDPAITSFKRLEILRSPSSMGDGAIWVEARPQTGRTHQIRVHLSEDGLGILGDPLYGSKNARLEAPRCMLHAASLTFVHPVGNLKVTVQSPLPEDFSKCLERYRGVSAVL